MSEWARGDVVLMHDIYAEPALARAVDDYKGHLSVEVVRRSEDETVVEFTGEAGEAPETDTVHEFLNYLLDLSVRVWLSQGSQASG